MPFSQAYTLSVHSQDSGVSQHVEPSQALFPNQPNHEGSKVSLVVAIVLGSVIIVMVVSGLALVFFGRRSSR